MGIEDLARQAVIKYEKKLAKAQKAYLKALEANDEVTRVAFLLWQKHVEAEPDWEGPVTWDDWHDLTISCERDEWRKLAAEVIAVIKGNNENLQGETEHRN